MKRIETFQADDGKEFATEQECLDYEKSLSEERAIELLIAEFTSNHVVQLKLASFFQQKKERVREILNKPTQADGWISNENNNSCFSPIDAALIIEIQRRNGGIMRGRANDWLSCWRSTDNDPFDIVKYRIIK